MQGVFITANFFFFSFRDKKDGSITKKFSFVAF